MFMSAALWRGGREIWGVRHRGGDFGDTDLVVEGTPPDVFQDLRASYLETQTSLRGTDPRVDYVADIPLELARSVVGFRYDVINPGIDDTTFRALRSDPAGLLAQAARPRWKFW